MDAKCGTPSTEGQTYMEDFQKFGLKMCGNNRAWHIKANDEFNVPTLQTVKDACVKNYTPQPQSQAPLRFLSLL